MEGRNTSSSESYVIGIPLNNQFGSSTTDVREQQRRRNSPAPVHIGGELSDNAVVKWILILLVGAGFVCVIVFLINSIIGHNTKFGLNSLSVSNFNISGSEISGIWNVEFVARNPDFLRSQSYEAPTLYIFYKDRLLYFSGDLLPRIHIPKTKTVSYAVKVTMSMKNDEVADAIANELTQQGGVVSFTVRLQEIRPLILDLTCANIQVGFSNDSSSSTQGTMVQQYSSPKKNKAHQQAFARCSSYAPLT